VAALWLTGLLALAARLAGLTRDGFGIDEVSQASTYGYPLGEIAGYAARHNLPPLDYWIGHFAFILSPSDFALRLPAALFGAGSAVLLVLVARRLLAPSPASGGLALLAGLLFAVLPYPVQIGQELRSYSSPTFFVLAFLWLCLRALEKGTGRLAGTALFFVTLPFLLTRTEGPAFIVALASLLMTALLPRKGSGEGSPVAGRLRAARSFLIPVALATAAAAPLLLAVLKASPARLQAPGDGVHILLSDPAGAVLGPLGRAFTVQLDLIWPLLLPLIALGLAAAFRRGAPAPLRLAGALLAAGPLLHLVVFRLFSGIEPQPGYLFHLAPLALALAAVGAGELGRLLPRLGRSPTVSAAALLLAVSLLSFGLYQARSATVHEDWRGLSRHLASLPRDTLLISDGVVPLLSFESAFLGLPLYFHPGKSHYREEEVDARLRSARLPPVDDALFQNEAFIAHYIRKVFVDLEMFTPRSGEQMGHKSPQLLQMTGWALDLPGEVRQRLAPLGLLPFHPPGAMTGREPVLVLEFPFCGRLTPLSLFPLRTMAEPKWSRGGDFASDPGLEVTAFSAFRVVRLARPTGDFRADLRELLDRVTPFYPRDTSRFDPEMVSLWLDKDHRDREWESRFLSLLRLAEAERIDPLEVFGMMGLYVR
jgi:4-amino-4-deoxy-L-arabinose transferase-like glycosyltransferase